MIVAFISCWLALLFNASIVLGASDQLKKGKDVRIVAAAIAMAWINLVAIGVITTAIGVAKWGGL